MSDLDPHDSPPSEWTDDELQQWAEEYWHTVNDYEDEDILHVAYEQLWRAQKAMVAIGEEIKEMVLGKDKLVVAQSVLGHVIRNRGRLV